MAERRLFSSGKKQLLFTWAGDWVNDALVLLFKAQGLSAQNDGLYLAIDTVDAGAVVKAVQHVVSLPAIDVTSLTLEPQQTIREKWDWTLPEEVRVKSFASQFLEVCGALLCVAPCAKRCRGLLHKLRKIEPRHASGSIKAMRASSSARPHRLDRD